MPRGSCKNRLIGGAYLLHHHGDKNRLARNVGSNQQLKHAAKEYCLWLPTANVVPSLPIHVTLMMEEICSSETSGLATTTRRNIPEDGILHSHRRENLKSYTELI
jgi:hypothetical protein